MKVLERLEFVRVVLPAIDRDLFFHVAKFFFISFFQDHRVFGM